MKAALACVLFFLCINARALHPTEPPEYSIIFGKCFVNEQLSLKINNRLVFQDYKMITNGAAKGNLSLTQTSKGLVIHYNSRQQKIQRIKTSHVIHLSILVNDIRHQMDIDLRKGKVIVLNYCAEQDEAIGLGKISFEQIQETLVLL